MTPLTEIGHRVDEPYRLIRYDRRIVINGAHAAFPQWRDRLLALSILVIVLVAGRAYFSDRPWVTASWLIFGISAMFGMICGRVILSRLAFHASEGPIAADALRPAIRSRYQAYWHAIGIAALAIIIIVTCTSLVIITLPGYAVGALLAQATGNFAAMSLRFTKKGARRRVLLWLRRPISAGAAAAVLLTSLALLSSSLTPNVLTATAGIETALLVLSLTTIDPDLIRFMAIAGHGSWRTIMRQGRVAVLFLSLSIPLCLLLFGQALAFIVTAVGAAGLFLMVIRTLAFRIHRRRSADFLAAVAATVLGLALFAAPIIFPLVAVAILWMLQRRASAKTWLLS